MIYDAFRKRNLKLKNLKNKFDIFNLHIFHLFNYLLSIYLYSGYSYFQMALSPVLPMVCIVCCNNLHCYRLSSHSYNLICIRYECTFQKYKSTNRELSHGESWYRIFVLKSDLTNDFFYHFKIRRKSTGKELEYW